MTVTELGRHSKEYRISLYYWAKRLEATEMVINRDGTVTLSSPDGYICENYRPTARELAPKRQAVELIPDYINGSIAEYAVY